MKKLLALAGATVGGAIGWWLGSLVGFMTAFFVSIICTALGVYAGTRTAQRYLG